MPQMNKDGKFIFLAYGLIFIELIIQIFGGIYYEQTPQFVWDLGNSILIFVPLLFGLRTGLLCLFPVAVSEIVWFAEIITAGPSSSFGFFFDNCFDSWNGKRENTKIGFF